MLGKTCLLEKYMFSSAIIPSVPSSESVLWRREVVVVSLRWSTNAHGGKAIQERKSFVLDSHSFPALRPCTRCFCLAYLCHISTSQTKGDDNNKTKEMRVHIHKINNLYEVKRVEFCPLVSNSIMCDMTTSELR